MNVVDSSAWLAYFADSPNAGRFAKPIEETAALIVPTITLLEVFKRVLQERDEQEAVEKVGHMKQGTVVDLDAKLALEAAKIGLELACPWRTA